MNPIQTLKRVATAIINVPIGLFLILTGVLYVAAYAIPARLGVGFAQELSEYGHDYISKGVDRVIP